MVSLAEAPKRKVSEEFFQSVGEQVDKFLESLPSTSMPSVENLEPYIERVRGSLQRMPADPILDSYRNLTNEQIGRHALRCWAIDQMKK